MNTTIIVRNIKFCIKKSFMQNFIFCAVNTYLRTIKMKPIDVNDKIYIDSIKEINDKDPKFKVDDHVRISKYKNIFAKGHTPNWSEECFVIKKYKYSTMGIN